MNQRDILSVVAILFIITAGSYVSNPQATGDSLKGIGRTIRDVVRWVNRQ